MTFEITFVAPDGQTQIVPCEPEDYILDAADAFDLTLPYSCRSGACGACAGKLTAGTVDQSDGSFLDDEQIEQGFVLQCVARATSDCTILIEQEENLY